MAVGDPSRYHQPARPHTLRHSPIPALAPQAKLRRWPRTRQPRAVNHTSRSTRHPTRPESGLSTSWPVGSYGWHPPRSSQPTDPAGRAPTSSEYIRGSAPVPTLIHVPQLVHTLRELSRGHQGIEASGVGMSSPSHTSSSPVHDADASEPREDDRGQRKKRLRERRTRTPAGIGSPVGGEVERDSLALDHFCAS